MKRTARSPAGDGAVDPAEVLALHEFLDLSKVGCADRRHRIMLHHCDLGQAIAQMAFPKLQTCSKLVGQHVEEDLGFEARLADWLAGVDFARLPQPVLRRVREGPDGIARMVLARAVGSRPLTTETRQLHEHAAHEVASLLWLPLKHVPNAPESVLSLLMNCVGPALARAVFGPPSTHIEAGQLAVIDWGWLAEAAIMASFGRIPDYAEVVRCVAVEPRRMARAS